MVSNEELEQLRHKGESADLDFKQGQYPFAGASDHQKSELLKDIMAMANAYRAGPGYILIGFKDLTPHPAEVVGISTGDHIDDASLQQLVRSKLDPVLEFQYEERVFADKHVAVITIPKQPRPFAPKQDFGSLRKNVALVRRGSSTDEASMLEMTKMALADAGSSRTASVHLRIDTEDNYPLPDHLTLNFLRFGKLPDYEIDSTVDLGNGMRVPMVPLRSVNRAYYREAAEYHSALHRRVLLRLSLANQSDFALAEVKLELTCSTPQGESAQILNADDFPHEPDTDYDFYLSRGVHNVTERSPRMVNVDDRRREPVCHATLGTLRPGETGTADSDIALLPSGPGHYTIRVRILAKELPAPIVYEHAVTIDGATQRWGVEDLIGRLLQRYRDDSNPS